jgi:hypothetical protein
MGIRLQIPMNDAMLVCELHTSCQASDHFRGFTGCVRCVSPRPQRFTFDQGHHDKRSSVTLAYFVDGTYVRMTKSAGGPRLAEESLAIDIVCDMPREFDRHIAIQTRLPSLDDDPHATLA